MAPDQGREATPGDVSRLVYGYAGGRRHGPRRTAAAIAAAQRIDEAMGRLRLAEPKLLVSGFWRSGTTWLQESLACAIGGKTVFEPLAPMEPRRRAALTHLPPDDPEDLCQATIPGPQAQASGFWADLDRACTGRSASPYGLSCRRSVGESFRRAIVVKDVRLQANLAAFHHRYRAPVVHMRRHPYGVVASLAAADWHWSFARAPLALLLPRLSTALSDAERTVALRFDVDTLSRTAAMWAITERLAMAALRGQPWGVALRYERFVAQPDAMLSRVLERLDLKRRRPVDFSAPSVSVDPEAFAAYRSPPLERWNELLSRAEIDRVEAVVDAIYPDWRVDGHDGML